MDNVTIGEIKNIRHGLKILEFFLGVKDGVYRLLPKLSETEWKLPV